MTINDDHQPRCAHCGFAIHHNQLVRGLNYRDYHFDCLDELVEQEEAAAVAAENIRLSAA